MGTKVEEEEEEEMLLGGEEVEATPLADLQRVKEGVWVLVIVDRNLDLMGHILEVAGQWEEETLGVGEIPGEEEVI